MWPGTKVGSSSSHLSPINPSFPLLQVLKPFLEDSKYQNLLPLFVGHNLLLVSEEPKVKEMVRILKGMPFLPLLGEQTLLPVGDGLKGSRCYRSVVPSARHEWVKPWTSLEGTSSHRWDLPQQHRLLRAACVILTPVLALCYFCTGGR